MIVDWERIAELQDEIGADGFGEVVDLFLEEADEATGRLAICAGVAALEGDLHFLKGAALNLGFAEFAALCQDGERRAAAGDAAINVAAVRTSYARSKQALLEGLRKTDAA